MNIHRRQLLLVLALTVFSPGHLEAQEKNRSFARPEHPTSIWFSSGDALFEYHWMPMASPATVDAAYDIIQKRFNVDRMLWRDSNVQWIERWNKTWPYSYLGEANKDWIRFCTEFKVAEHAEQAARQRGMQFWGIWTLYDYGGKASTRAGEGQGPWETFDPWLHAHPQFCVYDRAGITYNTSVIEYGYPEVRKEYARRVDEMFNGPWKPYDGLFMYTYIEHSSVRYTDEYIYTGIACEEYKKRYGVDPRTEPFDLKKYYEIRGDYITEYFRTLRPIFKKHGKKLAVALNAKNLEWPQEWIAGRADVLQQGLIRMDWQTWVREGLVDELNIWGGVDEATTLERVKEVLAETKGKDVKVTVLRNSEFPQSMQHLYSEGVRRVTFADDQNEDGYREDCPASEVSSDDPLAILSVLRQAREGKIPLQSSQLGSLLKHSNPLVRRQAARAIGLLRAQKLIPALEEAVKTEAEVMVVAMMIDAFAEINGPKTMAAIEIAFKRHPVWPVRRATILALGKMGKARRPDILKAFGSDDAYFRAVLLESIYDTEQPDKSAFYQGVPEFSEMLRRGSADPDPGVRLRAAYSLSVYPNMDTAELLLKLLDDSVDEVQSRAARSINSMLQNAIYISAPMRGKLFEKLMTRYLEFGQDSKRTDAEWGFRPFGEAIRAGFGIEGKNALIDILNGSNIDLAKLTWQVLFLHEDYRWPPVAREKMEAQYQYYPNHPAHRECPHVAVE